MIRCKTCNKTFKDTTEYLKFEGCELENCTLSKTSRARREANAAIEKARGFKEMGGLEQVETKGRYVNHMKETAVEFVNPAGMDETYERECANVITFHVMKR